MINFGQLSRRFIPPTPRRPDYSRFSNIYTPNEMDNNFNDPEQPLPIRPFPTQVPQQQPKPQPQQDPYNFIDEYSKLNSNRPNRLAYRQAVEQGPEQIKRSGWARLGTALTSGAAALGGESVSDAAALGINAYNAPQVRANQRYKERVEGLGNLANMEDSDMQEKIKVLEMQNKDWYAQREDKRQNAEAASKERLTNAQITNYAEDNELKNWHSVAREDGHTYLVNYKTGVEKNLGKTSETSAEKTEAEKAKFAYEQQLRAKADKESDERQAASSYRNVMAAQEGQNQRTQANNASKALIAAAKLKDSAQTSTGAMRQQKLDLAAAINSNHDLAGYDLDSMIEEKSGIFKVKDNPSTLGMGGDSEEVKAVKSLLREILARGAGPNATSNMVRMIDPEGNEFDAKPEDVEHYKGLKARVK